MNQWVFVVSTLCSLFVLPPGFFERGWATEGVSVFAGAFLGAFIGHALSQNKSNRERYSKRDALLEQLDRELSLLTENVSGTDTQGLMMLVPVRVNVIPRLLDGELLEYREFGTLLDYILTLELMISRYNDWVQLTNEAQTAGALQPDQISQMHQTAIQMLSMIAVLRNKILRLRGITDTRLAGIRDILEEAVTPPSSIRK